MDKENIISVVIATEKAALERWNNGDPSGYLEIYDPDITYFDPFTEKRFDGFDRVKNLYEGLRGKISVQEYKMIDPLVQITGDVAVLTYNLVSRSSGVEYKWNCTEIYRIYSDGHLRIIHNHWSFTEYGYRDQSID
jgi:ketosteroid isomerase-like protein